MAARDADGMHTGPGPFSSYHHGSKQNRDTGLSCNFIQNPFYGLWFESNKHPAMPDRLRYCPEGFQAPGNLFCNPSHGKSRFVFEGIKSAICDH